MLQPISVPVQRPNVFDYLDYRQFVADMLRFLKHRRISARNIAKRVGFGSPNYLLLIASKKRNLSPKTALLVGLAFKLSKPETLYFEKLVKYALAEDLDDQGKIFKDLQIMQGMQVKRDLSLSEYSFYRDWKLVALYEAIPQVWATADRKKLQAALQITPETYDSFFAHLKALQLVETRGGHCRKVNKTVEAPDAVFHEDLRRFHLSLLEMAQQKVESLPLEARHLGAVTLSLSESQFAALRKQIEEFKVETNARFTDQPDRKAVFQLQFQLFPILDSLQDLFKLE